MGAKRQLEQKRWNKNDALFEKFPKNVMNEKVRAALTEILNTMPQPDTVMMFATGSYAAGTASGNSDLDIYHIKRDSTWEKYFDTIKTSSGDMVIDVSVNSVEHAKDSVKLYGDFAHSATHDGILLFENRKVKGWRTMHDSISGKIRPADSTRHWLFAAEQCFKLGDSYRNDHKEACIMYGRSLYASLAACLTHNDIGFKFTKQFEVLVELLPDKSIVQNHDIKLMNKLKQIKPYNKIEITADDKDNAARMSKSVFQAVKTKIGSH